MHGLGLKRIFRMSRPRFWIYLTGPFLIGLVSVEGIVEAFPLYYYPILLVVLPFLFHFSFPANLFLYGVNDIFDEETDRLNEKKSSYEARLESIDHPRAWIWILLWQIPIFVYLVFLYSRASHPTAPLQFASAMSIFILFYLLSFSYSAPPIRAKARPFLDSASNILYILPGLFIFSLLSPFTQPDWKLILAASLWCIAMHAYSAVPDIKADTVAGLKTIATVLGKSRTLWLCAFMYAGSVLLSSHALGWLGYALGAVYLLLIALSLKTKTDKELFGYYKLFPWINTAAGTALFLFIVATR
ncbi:prenyltransferase [Candidatus Uhrbacteria bacterium]|nr:prenyltransferase [Candidatus Uhrbacteria bacterium]